MSTRGHLPALQFKKDRRWQEISWQDYRQWLRQTSIGLLDLGLEPGDRVAIFASTRFEWAVMDIATMSIGGIVVPIYHTMTPDEVKHILNDSKPRVLAVENKSLLKVFKAVEEHCPSVETLLVFDSAGVPEEVISFDRLMQKGREQLAEDRRLDEEWGKRLRALTLDTPATIIYTSGTTGQPKGVLFAHEQIASEVNEAFNYAGATGHDISLTFLPYSHVLGRIELWGSLAIGFTLAFAESIERIRSNLQEVKPTIMVAVPRIFEKIYLGINAQLETNPLRKKLFAWALGIGREISQLRINRRPVPLRLLPQFELADRLVLRKVREAFGGRLRFAISGGAPLNPEISQFFHACGVLVLEGYGLTETLAAVTVNTPFDYLVGTVGKPFGDVQLKIADDGEILVKSKKVMKEYYNNPEATAQVLKDGWFMTGDIGEILPTGQLRITDRKKDLIKTAGGKYVAPQKLEGLIKTHPLISQVHIHGDQRKYVVALVTLDALNLKNYGRERGLGEDLDVLTKNPSVQDAVRKTVAEANSQLASYETVKRFAILPHDFSIETGELTPSLKIKRRFVDQKFKKQLDAMYS